MSASGKTRRGGPKWPPGMAAVSVRSSRGTTQFLPAVPASLGPIHSPAPGEGL